MARERSAEARRKWTGLLAAYGRYEGTVAEFCRKHRVSAPSFYQWKRKLEKEADSGFVPVVVKPQEVDDQVVRFQLAGECHVDVPAARADLIVKAMLALSKGEQP